MGKAREFWIKEVTNDRDAFVIPFEVDNKKVLVDPRCIHVIEKSAYQKAVDTLKEIAKDRYEANPWTVVSTTAAKKAEDVLKELGELG